MNKNNIPTHYDRVQIILHWLIALVLFFMIGLGLYMVELPKQAELPPGEESVRAFYFLLHKSMGLTVAMLIILRVIWRLTHKAPPLPETISRWQRRVAGIAHGAIYVLMLAIPVSGYLQSMFSKYDTKFWGVVLPRMAEADKAAREQFSEVHEILAFLLIGLIAIHIIVAIKHRLAGSGVWERMSLKR